MLLDVVYDSVHLLRRHFVFTVLLDLSVLMSWLAAIIFRVRGRVYLLFGLVTLVAIPYNFARHTPSYTPPQKVQEFSSPRAFVLQHGQVDEPQGTIVGDVLPADGDSEWRWTNQRPALQFSPTDSDGWIFYIRFRTVAAVLKVTGPQTIKFSINGTAIDTQVIHDPQEYEFRYRVAPSLIKAGSTNLATMDIEPVFTAVDRERLGVLLHSMGFMEDAPR